MDDRLTMVRHVVDVRETVAEELAAATMLLDRIDVRALRAIRSGAHHELLAALREVRGEIEEFNRRWTWMNADGPGE